MHTNRAFLLLLAIGVLAAITTSLLDEHGRAASAGGLDCRLITGTPTASGTPSPTPLWTPYFAIDICNDTASAASDLHLVLRHPAVNLGPGAYPPGCPYPGYAYSGGDPPEYTVVDINYGTPCVDPGESLYIFLHAGCSTPDPRCEPPVVNCYYWTLDGQPIPSESPANNPTRCENAGPVPTPPTPTPTPTPPSTPTLPPTTAPPPTTSPTPTQRPGPDLTFIRTNSPTPTTALTGSSQSTVTAASLPRTGGPSTDGSLAIALLFAGLAVAVAGFALARRRASP